MQFSTSLELRLETTLLQVSFLACSLLIASAQSVLRIADSDGSLKRDAY